MNNRLYALLWLCFGCAASATTGTVSPGAGGSAGLNAGGSSEPGAGGSSEPGAGGSTGSGAGGSAGLAAGGPSIGVPVGGMNAGGSAGSGGGIVRSLPPGFTGTEIGGYQLGPALGNAAGGSAGASGDSGVTGEGNGNCGNILLGVVRDFRGRDEPGGHPDFEGPLEGKTDGVTPGLVQDLLDAQQKPVYASQCEEGQTLLPATCPFGPQTTSRDNFDQWYRFTPGVNVPHLVRLYLAPQAGGLFTFRSLFFFPLDGAGFGNSGGDGQGATRNFGFTTELHTEFMYRGGETFTFDGDDDVWVFINGRLAVDVGGLHTAKSASVDLDASAAELGIEVGGVYSLALFHAERHTSESTFRIDTNLSFVNCGTVVF